MTKRAAYIIAAALFAALGGTASAEPTDCPNPSIWLRDLTPSKPGPARLEAVYCVGLPSSHFTQSEPQLSPDTQRVAIHQYGAGLQITAVRPERRIATAPTDPTFLRFAAMSEAAFHWSSDGSFLWGVTQEHVLPSHFATGPLVPVRILLDGRIDALPALSNDAGSLDGLLWAGGDGLALAQFGAGGSYYRPERPNPSPTLAIVDAARGRVLQSSPLGALDALSGASNSRGGGRSIISDAVAGVKPDGKVQSVIRLRRGGWLVWTQDQEPRKVVLPYTGRRVDGLALSPDGLRLLVATGLQRSGMICESRVEGVVRPECEPSPVTGPIVALHDLRTGATLWTISRTVTRRSSQPVPAISPDGRFAMVGLPFEGVRPVVGLISVADGQVVQTFHAPSGRYTVGFTPNGRSAWAMGANVLALYDLSN